MLQFPGLERLGSNCAGDIGQPVVESAGMDRSGDATSIVISGTGLSSPV